MLAFKQVFFSIVIPVYNEVDNIEDLYEEITSVLAVEAFNYEVIFIDDGSNDGTCLALRKMIAKFNNVQVVWHTQNFGQSAALVSGAKVAKYPWIITMDGDGQNDPADIPLLLHQLAYRTVVCGNRLKRKDSFLRRASSYLANQIRQYFLKDGCRDTGCSLKLFSRDAFLALPFFNHLHRFLPALFKASGLHVVNYPVNHRPRLKGVSKYGVKNRIFVGIYDLVGVIWLLKRSCIVEIFDED